jgi:hypothetical protein
MAAEVLQNGIPQVQGKIRFADFAPDADSIIPGILLDMENLYPTAKGYRSYPALTRYSANTLPGECLSAFATVIGGSLILLAGTSDKLYYLSGTDLTDSGLTPTATTARWRFELYDGKVIATNGVDASYTYDGSSFGNLAGSPPVASIVQATDSSLFLIKANSSDWISTLNSSLWTPSIATETVEGTIRKGSGDITAAHRLRGGIAIYKQKSLVFGQFSGPPFYWDFGNGISDEIGTFGQEAVANLGDVHYFLGPDDFYSFDGYSLQRIPNQLKEWFFDRLNGQFAHLVSARWDQRRSLIFWHFPSVSANPETALDSWICFNLRTGKWSAHSSSVRIDCPIFTAVPTGQLTYALLTTTYPTYNDMDFMYGDLQSRTVDISAAFRTSDHALHLYNGTPGRSSFTTHDFGDRRSLYEVSGVRPHYEKFPEAGATLQPLNTRVPGKEPVAGDECELSDDGSFDFLNTARLQRFKHVGRSEYEITGLDVLVEYAGDA